MKSVYIETSIPSYLTARPNADIRAMAWQQITLQWWDEERIHYEIFISELVLTEASSGNAEAAERRLQSLQNIPELTIDEEMVKLAEQLILHGGIPPSSEADALHVATAAIHKIDYLMTWNCRHINNAVTKPIIRAICESEGYSCPEICTPLELLSGG